MPDPSPTPPSRPTNEPVGPAGDVARTLAAVRSQLVHVEQLVVADASNDTEAGSEAPGWLRPGEGEERWPVAVAVVVVIALQVALPTRLDIGPAWLLPALEAALLIGLTAANPRHIDRRSAVLRALSVGLIAVISIANGWSSYELIRGLITGTTGQHAGPLLAGGGSVYLTNIIVFGLWFSEWDRGGPAARALGERPYPDFLFPQMTQAHLAPHDWRPTFADYLYVSYTNATAFSPTDTMPLTRWAKTLMLIQSAIALTTVGLVIARAVNVFK